MKTYSLKTEVLGRKYELNHPGTRRWLTLRQDAINAASGRVDVLAICDFAFKECVLPDGHDFEPSIDELEPEEVDHWASVLVDFFRLQSAGIVECDLSAPGTPSKPRPAQGKGKS